jgi:hypothetical protein
MKTIKTNLFSAKPALLLVATAFLSACGSNSLSSSQEDAVSNDGGSIVLARPLPKVSSLTGDESSSSMLGFSANTRLNSKLSISEDSPFIAAPSLEIDASKGTIRLLNADENSTDEPIQILNGASSITRGDYVAPLKQKDPSWYAPDSYFTKRDLAVPAPFSSERFLRGALGEFAIFLNENTAIHNSKIYSKEVGGLQVSDADMSRLYYALEAGCKVNVR